MCAERQIMRPSKKMNPGLQPITQPTLEKPAAQEDSRVVFNNPTDLQGTLNALENIRHNQIVVYDTDKPQRGKPVQVSVLRNKVDMLVQVLKKAHATGRTNPVTRAREKIVIGLRSAGDGPPPGPKPGPEKPNPPSDVRYVGKMALT